MNIQIIADSTCDLETELLQDLNLKTLPLVITVGNEEYLDGETIQVDEIYDVMRQGIVPKTAQIPYDRTYNLFRSCLESGQDVIYISFSSAMSSCFSLASMVAAELKAEYPGRKIAVLDSRGGSGATGIIVLQALKMASCGAAFEEITAEVEFMAEHIEHEFSIDDLEWLAKGGRISKIVGTIGSKLGIHPILEVKKGSIAIQKMIRGRKKTVQEVADKIIAKAAAFPAQLIAITHADDILSAKVLESLIKEGLPNCLTTICHIGCVLGVHLGLKGIGAFCLNKKPKNYCLMQRLWIKKPRELNCIYKAGNHRIRRMDYQQLIRPFLRNLVYMVCVFSYRSKRAADNVPLLEVNMMDKYSVFKTNSLYWDTIGNDFLEAIVLPFYGAFVSEAKCRLFSDVSGKKVLEIGCGNGQSLRYLGDRGAAELWGVDLSEKQIEKAMQHLTACGLSAKLFCSPMEEDCGIPLDYFDFVYSIYAIGWTTDLEGTFCRIASYLKRGGEFIFSWSHPIHKCVVTDEDSFQFKKCYFDETWYSVPLEVGELRLCDRKLSTYVNALANAGFVIEQMIEETDNELLQSRNENSPFAKRAKMFPVTFVIKARKL